jgi:site-specific recombinase XerD
VVEEELNDYLAGLALSANSPSRSAFKHSVYGLRYYYRYVGLPNRAVKLPSLKKDARLPDVLNKAELKKLFVAPTLLKHRILLMLIYSVGPRSSELINLKKNILLAFDIQQIIERCYAKPWVVYSEPSLGNTKQIVEYLAKYTHRVAISNTRIKKH